MNFEKLTEYLDSLEEKYGIPANDCKVTKEHEVIYRKVTGHADYKKKVPLTASHMFRLFSATKLFTRQQYSNLWSRENWDCMII